MMRAFIAIRIPYETKKELEEIQNRLKSLPLQLKWVSPANLHITLKFLGNINQAELEKIKNILSDVCIYFSPFYIRLEDFGFFPGRQNPRIFFLNFSSDQFLENISKKLEERLEKEGFMKEKKFKPHITLARIKSSKNIGQLLDKIKDLKAKGGFKVNTISIYESTLTSQGPLYEELFKSSLKS